MDTHHAILIYAHSLASSSIPEAYKIQSADVLHTIIDRVSIDTARELSRLAQQKPFQSAIRVFVVVTSDIAIEAQNALLKLLEEPPAHAVFYVVIPKTAFLLPTLRSRLSVFDESPDAHQIHENELFTSFLEATYGERLALIATKTKDKDLVWTESIMKGCEMWSVLSKKNKEAVLGTLIYIRTYIGTKGASSKMLLEELALTLPPK